MSNHAVRRDVLRGIGAALLVSGVHGEAFTADHSPSMTREQRANVTLVRDYLAAWDAPAVDIDAIVNRYMAPDVLMRWFDDEPTYVDRKSAAAAAKKEAPDGVRVISNILRVVAIGSVVVTSRIDTVKLPNKADQVLKITGVCVIRNGLIREYVDYTS